MKSNRFTIMTSILCAILLLLVFLTSGLEKAEAGEKENREAELYFLTGAVSLASYSDEGNLLVRNWLHELGWSFESKENINRVAAGRVHLLAKELSTGQDMYVMAFSGTEKLKDAEVDLRVSRVLFGGKTPAEFKSIAATKERDASQPQVHKGFLDYTQVSLFEQKLVAGDSRTIGEVIAEELKARPTTKLFLTGHSLGGAAATLAAARLSDMGVSPEQLEVITFGAPAVGNEAFARAYEKKMKLTRITMKGDPVKAVLQSLSGGFVQFGTRIDWSKNRNADRFPHEMVVYLDQAIRNYQDTVNGEVAEEIPVLFQGTKKNNGGIYVAPMEFSLSPELEKDIPYMKRAIVASLRGSYEKVVFAPEGVEKDWSASAKAAGCRYLIVPRYKSTKIRAERNAYRLTMEEECYDLEKGRTDLQANSTTTHNLTALEGMLYLQHQRKQERDKFCQSS